MNNWPEHKPFKTRCGSWRINSLHSFYAQDGKGELTPPEKELLAKMYWAGGSIKQMHAAPGLTGLKQRKYAIETNIGHWAEDTINLTSKGYKAAAELLQMKTGLF